MGYGPLSNAKDRLLTENPGSLPNLQGALLDWFQPMNFTKITKTVVNFSVVEEQTPVSTMGVRQPMSPQMLQLRPEGERSWRFETVHALPDLPVATDDIVVFKGTPYRVMGKLDYAEYGYVELHITQDYTT